MNTQEVVQLIATLQKEVLIPAIELKSELAVAKSKLKAIEEVVKSRVVDNYSQVVAIINILNAK